MHLTFGLSAAVGVAMSSGLALGATLLNGGNNSPSIITDSSHEQAAGNIERYRVDEHLDDSGVETWTIEEHSADAHVKTYLVPATDEPSVITTTVPDARDSDQHEAGLTRCLRATAVAGTFDDFRADDMIEVSNRLWVATHPERVSIIVARDAHSLTAFHTDGRPISEIVLDGWEPRKFMQTLMPPLPEQPVE